MSRVAILVILLIFCKFAISQKLSVSGYIRDSISKEVLIGVNVYDSISKSGTSSNNLGFYSLNFNKGDSVSLNFSYIGYERQTKQYSIENNINLDIYLSDYTLLSEVEIIATGGIYETSAISLLTIPIAQIKNMPSIMGEVDVIRSFQLMPGVFAGKEGTSGIYVRGGSPDQNLFLLDDIPLYYVSHIGGFLSTFDADAINDVKLYKGGFPARYGGRLSSVIDLRMKDGSKKETSGEISIGTLSTKLSIEGPIKRDTSSYFVSFRRCNVDLITRAVSLFDSEGKAMAGYTFYDLYTKYNKILKNGDRFFISIYSGRDNIFLNVNEKSQDVLNPSFKIKSNVLWGNNMASMKYARRFNKYLFSNISFAFTRYNYRDYISSKSSAPEGGELINESNLQFTSGVNDVISKADFDLFLFTNHKIKTGIAAIYHIFYPGNAFYSGVYASGDTTPSTSVFKMNAFEANIYIEDEFKIGAKIDINTGLHFSDYFTGGNNFRSFQPRININYRVGNTSSCKLSYVRMNQYLHLLSNSGAGLPSDLWLPASNLMPPETADQISAGFFHTTKTKRPIEISGEAFVKKMQNLIEYKEGTNFFGNNQDLIDKVETNGSAIVYGVEILAQKKVGRTTGWIAYTWSKNMRQFENINEGKPFPYKYDRRHDFSIVVNHEFNEKISLSATWVYSTGDALTLATNQYGVLFHNYNSNTGIPYTYYDVHLYNGRNSYRMPAFHKLDIGISFFKQNKHGVRTWNISVYNAYWRQNAFFLYYKFGKLYQVSLFPIIPSVSYSFKF